MRLVLYVIVFCLYSIASNAQITDLKEFDYSRVDSIARNFNFKSKNTQKLVNELTDGIETEHEKFRVIFVWITDNIAYDISRKQRTIKEVMKDRKAVCSGYSELLKHLCGLAGLETFVVSGYSKTRAKKDIGQTSRPFHSWNAVNINAKYYLVDATWAAGKVIKRFFLKDFNEAYFLTPPEKFILNHYPFEEDYKWRMLDDPIDLETFINNPVVLSGYFDLGLNFNMPCNGIVSDTLRVDFSSEKPISLISYRYSGEDTVRHLPMNFSEVGFKSCEIILDEKESGILELIFNGITVSYFKKIRNPGS